MMRITVKCSECDEPIKFDEKNGIGGYSEIIITVSPCECISEKKINDIKKELREILDY